jgi:predicted lipid carrier protein YhbT
MRGHLPTAVGWLMGFMPMLPFELICRQLADNAAAARPSLATRLGDHAGSIFAIDPVDCPFVFLVTLAHVPAKWTPVRRQEHAQTKESRACSDSEGAEHARRHGRPSLALRRDLRGIAYAARIAAPLVVLIGMLDGSYDGDALFFSRDLVIEGDTSAVLALRNALDDAEIDPATLAGVPAPLKAPFNRGAEAVLDGLRRLLDAPPPTRAGAPGPAS